MRTKGTAKELGVSADWLRELEKQGKIPAARRDINGHRRYTEEDIARLRQIIFGESQEK